jgi:glycine oxidase
MRSRKNLKRVVAKFITRFNPLSSKHYLIIGSGLMGRLLAWRLLKAGNKVDILSSDDVSGSDSAGFIAASMVSPATEAISAEPVVKTVGLRSLALWPEWLKELDEPVFYQDTGTLVVAHSGDAVELERFKRRADHMSLQEDYVSLNQQQLLQSEPELADNFDQALFFEQESCIDNRHLYAQLSKLLKAEANWQQCEEIECINDETLASECQQAFGHDHQYYDSVIDCRGNGAAADLENLRSVRGEVIRVHAPDVSFKHCVRLMHPRYPFYLAPRPDNEYVLGATVIESDDRSEVTVRSGLELMSALYSVHKGFGEARILEMAAHCRPALPNNLPQINKTSWGYQLNGLYRHGYLFGPAIISDLLTILEDQANKALFGEFYNVA